MSNNKPWLKHYPEGVPAEIDLDEFTSVVDVLNQACERFADLPAFSNMGTTLTYAEVDEKSQALANWFGRVAGLKRGDRVALMMPNILQYPVAIFGALRAGLTVVNTNPMYTARELKHQLKDSGAKAIVVLENFADTVQKVLEDTPVDHVVITGVADMLPAPKRWVVSFVIKYIKQMVPDWRIDHAVKFTDALEAGAEHDYRPVDLGHDDVAFLQYTGGTTGVAKGAVLTHRNMIANMQQASSWLGDIIEYGKETIITALPLYHIFALTANGLVFMKFGGLNHLITNPRDMDGFVKELGKTRFTAITGVNTLFNGLLNTDGFADLDFSPLKMTLGGGMAVQRSVAEHWKKVTGVTLVEAYGLTEASPAVCINPMDLAEYNHAIGLPICSTDCEIRDPDGNALPQGEVGELCAKGPQVMREYWKRPEETDKVLSNGWLKTGDMAKMDEQGFFYIVDRKKDMILVSGFNVYPNEIEDVVAAHPKVLEVGAIGVPDSKSGEAVKIVVVKKDQSLTEDELKAHCKEQLTGYKRPRFVEFRDELPKSNVGKILRKDLRDSPRQ